MASETLVRRTCDRCKKVIAEEASPKQAGSPGTEKCAPTFILEVRRIQPDPVLATKGEAVQFDDLCTKCIGRVLDLVGQIRLEKAEGDDKTNQSGETLDAASKPKDNKGSKPAEAKPA